MTLFIYLFLHCALARCGAVYCNRSCLWVCVFATGGRAGGRCPNLTTASARAVFASLWALFHFFLRHAQRSFDRFWRMMVQNARNHMSLLGLKYLILTSDPTLPPPKKNVKFCRQNSNFKPKWCTESPSMSETTKLLTWKFDTMLRTRNNVLICNMMTS